MVVGGSDAPAVAPSALVCSDAVDTDSDAATAAAPAAVTTDAATTTDIGDNYAAATDAAAATAASAAATTTTTADATAVAAATDAMVDSAAKPVDEHLTVTTDAGRDSSVVVGLRTGHFDADNVKLLRTCSEPDLSRVCRPTTARKSVDGDNREASLTDVSCHDHFTADGVVSRAFFPLSCTGVIKVCTGRGRLRPPFWGGDGCTRPRSKLPCNGVTMPSVL